MNQPIEPTNLNLDPDRHTPLDPYAPATDMDHARNAKYARAHGARISTVGVHTPTTDLLARHNIGAGQSGIIWDNLTGEACRATVDVYRVEFPGGPVLDLADYPTVQHFILAVRNRINPEPVRHEGEE